MVECRRGISEASGAERQSGAHNKDTLLLSPTLLTGPPWKQGQRAASSSTAACPSSCSPCSTPGLLGTRLVLLAAALLRRRRMRGRALRCALVEKAVGYHRARLGLSEGAAGCVRLSQVHDASARACHTLRTMRSAGFLFDRHNSPAPPPSYLKLAALGPLARAGGLPCAADLEGEARRRLPRWAGEVVAPGGGGERQAGGGGWMGAQQQWRRLS